MNIAHGQICLEQTVLINKVTPHEQDKGGRPCIMKDLKASADEIRMIVHTLAIAWVVRWKLQPGVCISNMIKAGRQN